MDTIPRTRTVSLPVVAAGVATTAVTLGGAHGLTVGQGVDVTGGDPRFVLSVGTRRVGLLVGRGCGIAARLTGLQIRRATPETGRALGAS